MIVHHFYNSYARYIFQIHAATFELRDRIVVQFENQPKGLFSIASELSLPIITKSMAPDLGQEIENIKRIRRPELPVPLKEDSTV
jgi:hypothetical protein